VGFSALHAQEREGKKGLPPHDEDSALEIIDKKYNEETGDLLVVLRNRSDVTVTAFSIAVVSADSTGSGTTRVQGEEMFPGDGIAAGASYELKVALGAPDELSSRFSARAVILNHEIRSDNTSYGNSASIDKYFERRTAYFVELKEALTRLRGEKGRSGIPGPVLPRIREEAARGKEARRALVDPQDQHTRRDRARLAAVASIGDMAEQAVKGIEAGQFVEQTVANLELFLETELAHASRNIRPVDLERYER
jgi:hypothetical protein